MNKPPVKDATRYYFLGCVDYAQHNFARLKPLLYTETGRAWEGMPDRSWFPNEGLVHTVQNELKYAPQGSLWTFRIAPKARGESIDKDVYGAVQLKPAMELCVGMEPTDIEVLRVRLETHG